MSYNIVQHRRGTTQEWLEIDLIPYDGELVIEECDDGLRKCKIGDGQSRFSELPYITDKAYTELLSKIASAAEGSLKSDQALLETFNENFQSLSDAINEKIDVKVEALSSSINNSDEAVLRQMQEYTDEKLVQQADELTQTFQTEFEKTAENITTLEKKVDETFAPINDHIENSINSALLESEKKLTEQISVVKEELNQKISLSESDVELEFELTNQKIVNLESYIEEDIRPELINSLQKLSNKIEGIRNNTILENKKISESFNTKTDSNTAMLLDTITNLSNRLSTFEDLVKLQQNETVVSLDLLNKKVVALIEDSVETLEKIFSVKNSCILEMSALKDLFTVESNKSNSQILELNNRLDSILLDVESLNAKLNQELSSQIEVLDDKIEGAIQISENIVRAMHSNNDMLSASIENIRLDTEVLFSNIEDELEVTNIYTQKIYKNLTTDYLSLNTKIKTLIVDFDTKLESLNEELYQTKVALANTQIKLTNNYNQLNTQINKVFALQLQEGSTTGDVELADIRTDYKGNVHYSAGDAVRSLGHELENFKMDLAEKYPERFVDSLYYDQNKKLLYLLSKGTPVGEPVAITSCEGNHGSYVVNFYNPSKDGNVLLKSLSVAYGNDASLDGQMYTKLDTMEPEKYAFVGWLPEPCNVTKDIDCFAQFTPVDDTYYIPTLSYDLSFEVNDDTNELTITKCKNSLNKIIKIPGTYTYLDKEVTVKEVGGFNSTSIEHVTLEFPIQIISDNGFYNCVNLGSVDFSDSLTTIGTKAFAECPNLIRFFINKNVNCIKPQAFEGSYNIKIFEVDPENSYYTVLDNCLIQIQDNCIIAGTSDSIIPKYIESIADGAFYGTNIKEADLPDTMKYLGAWTFTNCKELTSAKFPKDLSEFGEACFAWCSKLENVSLSLNLKYLPTYAFTEASFEEITIPKSVGSGEMFVGTDKYAIDDHALALNTNLKSITILPFDEDILDYSNYRIHDNAFIGSGHEEGLTINVPWKENEVLGAPWGAGIDKVTGQSFTQVTINYEWKES